MKNIPILCSDTLVNYLIPTEDFYRCADVIEANDNEGIENDDSKELPSGTLSAY